MDLVLESFDHYLGDALYSSIPLSTSSHCTAATASTLLQSACNTFLPSAPILRDAIPRQLLSLFALTYAGIFVLYFSLATLSYYTLFDHRMMTHPRFLPSQVKQEIKVSMDSFAPVAFMTLPWFLGDVRGWSKLYGSVAEGPFGSEGGYKAGLYMAGVSVAFLLFTDFLIYFVHKALHHPIIYKKIHKAHHKFLIPTPFASHAFHPLDGYLNSIPYHLFIYIFPVHKYLFLGLFAAVNAWTILIHDSDLICDSPLENYINGPSHHTLHHLYFTCNYGQYFTYADKWNGSFRTPVKGDDPLLAVLAAQAAKGRREAEGLPESDGEGDSGDESVISVESYNSSGRAESSGASDSGFEEVPEFKSKVVESKKDI